MFATATTTAMRPAPRARQVSSRPRHLLATLCLLTLCAGAPAATGRGALPPLLFLVHAAPSAQDAPGSNGPPSHSQRAIQALTQAMSMVKGRPIRRKSLKRYWPGPRMRRLPW